MDEGKIAQQALIIRNQILDLARYFTCKSKRESVKRRALATENPPVKWYKKEDDIKLPV
jgi:hypothetical protein